MNKEVGRVSELVEERIQGVAKGLIKKVGKKRVLQAIDVFQEFGEGLYGSTEGDYSKNKVDWEIIKISAILNDLATLLRGSTKRK